MCYADDCTYCVSDRNTEYLQFKIEESFQKISQYMNSNKLFLNSDKTHLLVLTSSSAHSRHGNYGITLNTGTEIIQPSEEERLLGANLKNDLL